MNTHRIVPWALAICVLAPAAASPVLTAQYLHQICRAYLDDDGPHSVGARDCAIYVQGVLDGLAVSVRARDTSADSWAARAARTRLGPRMRTLSALRVEPQCPPPTLAEAVSHIVAYLDRQDLPPDVPAAEVMATVLAGEAACGLEQATVADTVAGAGAGR